MMYDVCTRDACTRCERAEIGMEHVIGIKAFELERVLEMDPTFLTVLYIQCTCSVPVVNLTCWRWTLRF